MNSTKLWPLDMGVTQDKTRPACCNGNCVQGRMCDCVSDDELARLERMPEGSFIACLLPFAVALLVAAIWALVSWGAK